jgi:4-amino-4-deoxy-L-arabinose transferase-like glycosyltransferase
MMQQPVEHSQCGETLVTTAVPSPAELRPFSYFERECWALILLTLVMYAPRLSLLTIRGEESRRAVIAREMISGEDWVVPRTQGVVRLSRPPFQNWLIAASALALGELNALAIRWPGVLATVFTVWLIYWYSRGWLNRLGAFAAAIGYATMIQVLEQGRTGETEPVFTALIAGSLLIWHRNWAAGRFATAWCLGGLFAGLAMLTKGLQAPLYFWGSTWIFLLITTRGRGLMRPAHAWGWLVFLLVIGSWQWAFVSEMGWQNGITIYTSNVAKRFHDDRWSTFWLHLVTYPPSVLVCLLPWSLLLLAYFQAEVRQALLPCRPMLQFVLCAAAVCFPSVWLPPEARPRYFMPLFPCLAVCIGAAVQGLAVSATPAAIAAWQRFGRLSIAAMLVGSLTALIMAWGWPAERWSPPLFEAIGFAAVGLVLAAWTARWVHRTTPGAMQRVCLGLSVFLGAGYLGPVLTTQWQRSEQLPAQMDAMRQQLPANVRLVSFASIHHVFLHYYGQTVPLLPWPQAVDEVPDDVEYFCVHVNGEAQPSLPFSWTEIASLSVDRNRNPRPKERIVVGRRHSQNDNATLSTADRSPVRR